GGEPAQFGLSVEAFHKRLRERRANWPYSLLATSTHDTKRGEDVRARINVLSEIPDRWRSAITRWAKFNKRFRTEIDEVHAPDRNEEYLLYQTLVGAWPVTTMDDAQYEVFIGRIQAYAIKAIREAKTHTSWVNPHEAYEEAVRGFVRSILDRSTRNLFLEDLLAFQEPVSAYGMSNALSQLLLKLTAPGIPDCYQGTELWELTLVDPDNRRPVDFALRTEMLDQLNHVCDQEGVDRIHLVRGLMNTWKDSRIKLYVLHTALRHRRANAELYLEGDYVPLDCEGRSRSHICAYARLHHDQAVVAVVPRLVVELNALPGAPGEEVWQDSWITVPSWKTGSVYLNLLTGERLETITQGERQVLPLARIFQHCPVALLERCS
ncbi:MAG: malto-oligosyltrehalose synthase, partial [Nitrospira sp.]